MTQEPAAGNGRAARSETGVRGLVILPPGAEVQTRDGALPAEHLMTGDDLIARDRGYVRLAHVSRLRQEVRTVWVRDGFLPGFEPEGGLLLPDQQPVLRWDGRRETAFPAAALAALGQAEAIGLRQLTLIQLWLPASDTVFAGGLALSAIEVPGQARRAA